MLGYDVAVIAALQRYVRRHGLLRAGDRVGVAVSGGADSVALLRGVVELGAELGVVPLALHLNHGLRGEESEGDAKFVAELAQRLGIVCVVESEDVAGLAERENLSLEAAGRKARYAFFLRAARAERLDAVATAHTRDDQAETVLLRLMRGAGTSGLAGIHRQMQLEELCGEERQGDGPRLIRPLLGTSRAEVEEYLKSLGQEFREDSSNRSREFLRNRVRGELLPWLEREFNPQIRAALAETAEVAAAENELLEEMARERLTSEGEIEVRRLAGESVALQRRMLRELCRRSGVALDFAQLEGLREFAVAGRAGRLGLVRGFSAELVKPKNGGARLRVISGSGSRG